MVSGERSKLSAEQDQSLKNISYQLYGTRLKPYIEFGITPRSLFPDLLLSIGPVFSFMVGEVTVNDETEQMGMAQSSSLFTGLNPLGYAYFQLELVLIRFGDGFFSFYISRAASRDGLNEGEFYPGSVDGMTNFRATLASAESGLKLLLNWP